MRKNVKRNKMRKEKLLIMLEDGFKILKEIESISPGYVNEEDRAEKCDSLKDLMSLHKRALIIGITNNVIGLSSSNTVRASDISDITFDKVFIGMNDSNFCIQSILSWEECKDSGIDDGIYPIDLKPEYKKFTMYQVALCRYKMILTSNIQSILKSIEKEKNNLERVGYGIYQQNLF